MPSNLKTAAAVLAVWASAAAIVAGAFALWIFLPAWVPLLILALCVFTVCTLIAMEP